MNPITTRFFIYPRENDIQRLFSRPNPQKKKKRPSTSCGFCICNHMMRVLPRTNSHEHISLWPLTLWCASARPLARACGAAPFRGPIVCVSSVGFRGWLPVRAPYRCRIGALRKYTHANTMRHTWVSARGARNVFAIFIRDTLCHHCKGSV